MHITIWEFLALTWEWIMAEYRAGAFNDAIQWTDQRINEVSQMVRNAINTTQTVAEQWLAMAILTTIVGLSISAVVFLLGILIGGFVGAGWVNAITGLLIAPILFILLILWTPLAFLLGVVIEITQLRFRGAPVAAVKYAQMWLRLIAGILLWQILVSLAFTFIPYWNAPSRIPVMILLALALALMGIRWGGLSGHRTIIKILVGLMFVIQIAVCFLPTTATALHSLLEKTDSLIATRVTTGAWIDDTKDRRIEKMSDGVWTISFKSNNPVDLPIIKGSRFLISASEAINLQWPVMGKPGEFCSVPLNTEITNKIFAKLTLKGEAGKTITVKLL